MTTTAAVVHEEVGFLAKNIILKLPFMASGK